MSEPTTVHEAELTQRCSRCGAAPGEVCTTPTGRAAYGNHTSRYFAARDAGLLPLRRRLPASPGAPPSPEGVVEGQPT